MNEKVLSGILIVVTGGIVFNTIRLIRKHKKEEVIEVDITDESQDQETIER